jgi:long-subunit fatty acid transport protein
MPDGIINISWDFYSNNRLSTVDAGKGYSGIASESDISGVVLNPANLSIKNKFQVHGEYVIKSDIQWGTSFGLNQVYLKPFHPSFSAGCAYKFNNFLQAGLLWNTTNSKKLDFGEIILTNEFGQEIGRQDMVQSMSINSLMLPVAFNYKNIFKAGVNLIMLYYHGNVNYVTTVNNPDNFQDANVDVINFNAQLGFTVMPFKDLSVGGTFTPQVKQFFTWKFADGSSFSNQISNYFPMRIGIGAEYRFRKFPLRVSFDYNYSNYSKQYGLKDRNDFNFGAEYDLLKRLTIRTGFFTLKDYRQNEQGIYYIDPIGKYDEYFLTAGFTYRFKKLSASLSLMDSHISPGTVKQTLLNGGITMDF